MKNQKTNTYGFLNKSIYGDNISVQLENVANYGLPKEQIFFDLEELLTIIQPGESVLVNSLEDLGQNIDEILKNWNLLINTKNVYVKIISLPSLDTSKVNKDLVTEVLTSLLQIEERKKAEKSKEIKATLAKAKSAGITIGRPKAKIDMRFITIAEKYKNKHITLKTATKLSGYSKNTFLKYFREYDKSSENDK